MIERSLLIRQACVLAGDFPRRLFWGDMRLENGRIVEMAPEIADNGSPCLNAEGFLVIPGLVQTHVHLCQSLFRGMADGLPLQQWLGVIKQLEARHSASSLEYAAHVGIAELLLSGVTTCSDIGAGHFPQAILSAAGKSGIRIQTGRTLADGGAAVGHQEQLREAEALIEQWHGAAEGRIRLAVIPRGVASVSDALYKGAVELSRRHGVPVHTHCAETETECLMVAQHFGARPVARLERLGVLDTHCQLAHCVAVSDADMRLLAQKKAHVLHCPGTNLKLGSGIAPVPQMLGYGLCVSLGSDGAPCNNRLDGFGELRLAALLHKASGNAQAVSAEEAFAMGTLQGARALGLNSEIGSLEVGKRADMVFVRTTSPHWLPYPQHSALQVEQVLSRLVYSAAAEDVDTVLVDGEILVRSGKLVRPVPEPPSLAFA